MKKMYSLLLTAAVATAAFSCPVMAEQDPIEIKLTTTDPSTAVTVEDMQAAAQNIYDRTDGMVDIQVYADGQMLVYAEGVEALMSNANLIMCTSGSFFVDYVPELNTVLAPYLFDTREIAAEFFESDYWDTVVDKCIEKGFYPISNNGLIGYRSVIAGSPVNSLEDMQKMDLRIPSSDVMIKLFEKLGVNYQTLAFADTFSACQTGMIDGLEGVPLTITANSLWDCLDPLYYSQTNHMLDVYGMYVGYDFWMSIPEEYRTIIEEELTAWGVQATADCVSQEQNEIKAQYDEHGVEIVEIEDLSEFKAVGEELIKEMEGGEEILAEVNRIAAEME